MHLPFKRKSLIIFAIFTFCTFIFSIILAFVIVPLVIDSQVDKNVILERGTDQWDRFRELPFNMNLNITLFEVKNVDDVLTGEIPELKEKGPYVFDILQKRLNMAYDEDTDLIKYERNQTFTFNKKLSGHGLTIDDTIDMINPAHIAIIQMTPSIIENFPIKKIAFNLVSKCLHEMFGTDYILKQFPVKKLIFEGYKVCDFQNSKCQIIGINLCSFFIGKSKNLEEIKTDDGEHYIKFSLMNYKTIPDGVYQVKSGKTNINELGDTKIWNDANYTKYWPNADKTIENDCDLVKGTDSTIYQPHPNSDTKIYVFSTDICRTVDLYYTGEGSYQGINGYYYKPKPDLLKSEDPENNCFCAKQTADVNGEDSCYLDGVVDLQPCIGAPVLLSFPHFLYADESYLKPFINYLKPNAAEHEIFLLLDTYTGVPLQAHEKVQLNIVLRPMEEFKDTTKFPRVILPIAWIDQGIELPPDGIDLLNSLLYDTLKLATILKWVFIGVSLAFTILACIILCAHLYSS